VKVFEKFLFSAEGKQQAAGERCDADEEEGKVSAGTAAVSLTVRGPQNKGFRFIQNFPGIITRPVNGSPCPHG